MPCVLRGDVVRGGSHPPPVRGGCGGPAGHGRGGARERGGQAAQGAGGDYHQHQQLQQQVLVNLWPSVGGGQVHRGRAVLQRVLSRWGASQRS